MGTLIEFRPEAKPRLAGVKELPREPAPDVRERPPLCGLSFEEWVQMHHARIWRALMAADRRNVTFDDFARALWAQIR